MAPSSSTVVVRFHPSTRQLGVAPGTTLLAAARAAGLPLGSSCRGEGACGCCRVRVLAGAQQLTAADARERALLRRVGAGDDERLACQAGVLGPVTVSACCW